MGLVEDMHEVPMIYKGRCRVELGVKVGKIHVGKGQCYE